MSRSRGGSPACLGAQGTAGWAKMGPRLPLDSLLDVEARASTILFIADDDLVRARVESNRLSSRMHAHDRVAPEHQPAIHQDVNTVVRPGVQVDRLRVRQVPEAAPFHAEQSPRQRGIFIPETRG